MPATKKTYDPACYDLAAVFLEDEPELDTEANRVRLAFEIQQCIEDELQTMASEAAGPL
jgi:hypothetical protein